jgi:NAD(P)-dependent dehydrogenase (short-subunit alcohol dehydrogenase family)
MPKEKKLQPPQHQRRQPGREHKMKPRPQAEDENHRGSGKLQDKVAIITGGDSGIGRAVAIAFAKEGADISICYLEEQRDATETKRWWKNMGAMPVDSRRCRQEEFCRKAVAQTVKEFGKLDILINNAAEQHRRIRLKKLPKSSSSEHFGQTFSRSFSW